jgi:SAM-dependent methyltransferase
MRKVTENVFQSDFEYASSNYRNFKYVVSVAIEHNYPWNTLYIPQVDGAPIDFWNLLRVVSLAYIADVYGDKTLIYCNAGISRSVAYSLAYLISKGLDLESAKKTMGVNYLLHANMEKSLRLFESRMKDKFFNKLFRYELIQMEALQNDSPVSEDRIKTVKKYVSNGSRVLITGCTSSEYEILSKLYDVECIHLNVLGKVGKFMMFEYNDYPDNYFDAVLAFDTLEHMYAPFITIGEVRRVLKEGGIFYHSTPIISDSMKTPWHVSLFSTDTWKWLFEWWDFKILEEKLDPDRITQVLRKEKYTKFDSYHKLVQIS